MRVLAACSLGGAGHLNPLRPFLRAAERSGHETLVVGPPALAELVGLAGHRFWAGGEPPESDVSPIRERLPVAPAAEASVLANRELFGRLATAAMLPSMERVFDEWHPHVVLREPCEYASAVVGHRLGIPTFQVAISFAEAEAGAIEVASPALNAWRKGLAEELRRSTYLTEFPSSLDPSPFATTVRFHEDRATRIRGGSQALVEWWGDYRGPRIYMTFGTVLGHMSIAASVYHTAMLAVAGLDTRVVLTVGLAFDRAALGPIPANVRVEAWVDQPDVLELADLVVCHGGSGTAFGALAAGVPLVVVPVFADQFENGRRIAEHRAGLMVERVQDVGGPERQVIAADDAPRIGAAIAEVLGDEGYRQRASRIASEMEGTPTVDVVLETLLSAAAQPR
jgi:UDP:flavonoid glycosyltransferase YjiC (YdhE family)